MVSSAKMKAWIRPMKRSNDFQIALGAHRIQAGNSAISADHDAAGEDVAEESQRQRDRLGDLLDDVDRRQEGDVTLGDLDGVADDAAPPDAGQRGSR